MAPDVRYAAAREALSEGGAAGGVLEPARLGRLRTARRDWRGVRGAAADVGDPGDPMNPPARSGEEDWTTEIAGAVWLRRRPRCAATGGESRLHDRANTSTCSAPTPPVLVLRPPRASALLGDIAAAIDARGGSLPDELRDAAMSGQGVVTDGIVAAKTASRRCWWADSAPEYRAYHDPEWGFPVADDIRLFEKLSLEGFQSGLSWLTILRKREAFRRAFAGFDFDRGRAVRRARRGAAARRRVDRPPPRQDRGGRSTTPGARSSWSRPKGSLAALRLGVRARRRAAGGCDRDAIERPHRGVARAGQGPQAPRLAVRRSDHGLRVHAGDGARQRPPGRVRGLRRGRARPRRVHAT